MTRNYTESLMAGGDFTEIGIPIFESEDLTDNLIRIYLALITKGWRAESVQTPLPLDKIANLYQKGLSLSCVKRVAISGQIDTKNDGIADFAAIPIQNRGQFDFTACHRVKTLPHGWSALPFSDHLLWAGRVHRGGDVSRSEKRSDKTAGIGSSPLSIDAWYYCVVKDRIFACKRNNWPNLTPAACLAIQVAAALQTVSDLKTLWNVETAETVLSSVKTPMKLGVDGEIVKSLFYARQAPITGMGRKRPILHWVSSHQRRIREGIDIDIREHLRGITEFEMDGFSFRITSPMKALAQAA